MNPIGSKEQRDRWRVELEESPGCDVWSRDMMTALGGLDIAEEMAEHGGHKTHCQGRTLTAKGLKCTCGWSDALAHWDAWREQP